MIDFNALPIIILTLGRNDEVEFALIATDEWQRRGLGSAFIEYTIEIARDKRLKKLYLWT